MYSDLCDVSDVSDLSSVPSSRLSSPEPVSRYLTPSSSQDAEDLPSTRQDCPPAKKKRRRNPLPKERMTQHLCLSKSSLDQQDQVRLLVQTLRYQKDIVVIAGAGISTSAGIPDFRSESGLFKSLQQKHNLKTSGKLLFDAAVYQDDALTAPFHELVRSLSEEIKHCKPTKFHEMLASLGKRNQLKRLYTQNIDGLETSMQPLKSEIPLSVKGRWPITIQLHGSIEKMVCQKCRHLDDLKPDQFCEADPPDCEACCDRDTARQATGQRSHGIGRMRPRMVLYNEHNPDEEAITSVMNADVRSRPRVLVVAGTSLKIPGVRRLVKNLCTVIRSRKDGVTMFINNEPPPGKEFENCFDLIVQGSTDQVADLVHLKPYTEAQDENEEFPEPVFGSSASDEESSASDFEREKKASNVSVVISTPKKRPRSDTGLMTPSSSQDEQSQQPAAKASKTANGSLANPASRGPNLNDVLKASNSKAAPAKGRKKPAATATASKKRGPKPSAPAKNASITTFSKVSKAAAAPETGKKNPLGAGRGNGLPAKGATMFPGLVKKAGTQNVSIPEVVSQ